jgi:hypothetical protein
MARLTHRIGFRHFTFGRWREPGELVDASAWPNRALLEESGYIHPLLEPIEAEEGAPPAAAAPGGGSEAERPTPVAVEDAGESQQSAPAAAECSGEAVVPGERPPRRGGRPKGKKAPRRSQR